MLSPDRAPNRERLLSRNFVLATAANLVFFTSVTTFFVLPVYLEDLGASRAEVGRIMGAFGATSLFAIPLTGALVDRYGRRPFMILGGLIWCAVAFAFSTVDRLGPLVVLLRLVQGVGFSFAFVSTNVMIADLAPRGSLGRAIAIFGTTTLATHAIGPTLGEIIASRFGFRVLYLISAFIAAGALAVFTTVSEPERAPPSSPNPIPVRMLTLALRKGSTSALVGGLTSALAFGCAMNFMPIFTRARGLESYSPFFASYVVAAILVRLFAGGAGDHFGYRRVGAGALACFAATVAVLSVVRHTGELIAVGFVFGVTHGWAYPSLNALFVQDAPSRARGRAMALFNLSFNAGVTLAAFLGGEIAERAGYGVMWLTVAALSGVGALVLVIDRPRAAGGS